MKIILLALLFPVVALADPLTVQQNAFEAAFAAELVADYQQSSKIEHFCDDRIDCTIHETNPLIGDGASKDRLKAYFASATIIHYGITYELPSKYRFAWQSGSVLIEGLTLRKNTKLGLHINF